MFFTLFYFFNHSFDIFRNVQSLERKLIFLRISAKICEIAKIPVFSKVLIINY